MSYVLGTYIRSVRENFISGKGSYLFNDKNEKYLDFVQGKEKFAERICKLTGFDAVGFQNSGAEATELAIKAAVKYFYSIGQKEKNRILCIKNSFHGRTIGTISAGNNPKHTEGFPILNHFDHD